MRKIGAALGWLILFAALGAAAMAGLTLALLHHLQPRFLLPVATAGAIPGALAWLIAMLFAALPGTRRGAPPFGLGQAVWGMCGTLVIMLCGAMLPYAAGVYLALVRILLRLPWHLPNRHDTALLFTSLLASELFAALWLSWYIRRQGPGVIANGSAGGIAWRPAAPRAYGLAAIGAVFLMFMAVAEFRLLPPDPSKLHNLKLVQLFHGPPAIALLTMLVVVLLAPVIEEFLFRGLAFAGIARKFGPGAAVVVTTLIFTALHAPEKIHYLPGFADVAVLALLSCALRLRYHSIRPGIAMHFLYNFGMLVVPVLAHVH